MTNTFDNTYFSMHQFNNILATSNIKAHIKTKALLAKKNEIMQYNRRKNNLHGTEIFRMITPHDARIYFNNGRIAYIDNLDLIETANNSRLSITNSGYLQYRKNGKTYNVHNKIFVLVPIGFVIDHINGNRLDNRLRNLRILSYKENCNNRH